MTADNQTKKQPYPAIDYMYGKHKPRIIEWPDGGFAVEIETTWPDGPIGMVNWTLCQHTHRSRQAAERCLFKWNDFAHDERERIVREGNGVFG